MKWLSVLRVCLLCQSVSRLTPRLARVSWLRPTLRPCCGTEWRGHRVQTPGFHAHKAVFGADKTSPGSRSRMWCNAQKRKCEILHAIHNHLQPDAPVDHKSTYKLLMSVILAKGHLIYSPTHPPPTSVFVFGTTYLVGWQWHSPPGPFFPCAAIQNVWHVHERVSFFLFFFFLWITQTELLWCCSNLPVVQKM